MGLRMLENQRCTAVAGDPSSSKDDDVEGGLRLNDDDVADLFRVCFVVFDRISPPKPSPALFLFHSKELIKTYMHVINVNKNSYSYY